MAGSLTEIEKDYNVATVVTAGEKIWPILRWRYAYALDFKSRASPRRKSTFELIHDVFYGFGNWFGGADVLFFSDSEQSTRRLINGEYYDRLVDPIIDLLNSKRCLLIEIPSPKHRPLDVTHTKRITSYTVLEVSTRILTMFEKPVKLENGEILKEIQKKYGLKIDDEKEISLFLTRKNIYKFLYQKLRPKYVFFVEYYRDVARVKAAKELSIPTIEIQHGSIGTEHPAYNSSLTIDGDYYPDQLLAYGESEKKHPNETFFYKPDQIHPIGNFIIDHINRSYKTDEKLEHEIRRYTKTVAITLQKTLTEKTMQFIIESAKLDPQILYLVVPRGQFTHEEHLPENLRIVTDPSFYELMKYVDIHVTVFSSCALEAPSLGVRNILINIDGNAKLYYGKVLSDESLTRYVETPRELVHEIKKMAPMEKHSIMEANSTFIKPGYLENLKAYLKELGLRY